MYEENVGLSGELIGSVRAFRATVNLMNKVGRLDSETYEALMYMIDDVENASIEVSNKLLLN